jgi:hypothetical protein
MKSTCLRSITTACAAFLTVADPSPAQIEEVHTRSGESGLRTLTGVRHNSETPTDFDEDEAPAAVDFLNYDEVVTSSSHLDAAGGLPALDANARASAEATLTSSATSLSFSASGDTSISATRTGGDSDNVSGAGGVSSLELSFTLTERCSFQFSAIALSVQTGVPNRAMLELSSVGETTATLRSTTWLKPKMRLGNRSLVLSLSPDFFPPAAIAWAASRARV